MSDAAPAVSPAHVIHRDFPPAPPRPFRMDRHYLLFALRGGMRLEAEGRRWSLPPARAVLIAAGEDITVALPGPLTALSVLFDPAATPPPPARLSVFDMTPLAREILLACRGHSDPAAEPDARTAALFAALAAEVWHRAAAPLPLHMPAGRSALVRRALDLTEARMADPPGFGALAADLAVTPRTLARRFAEETGATWRAALRRMRILRAAELLAGGKITVTDAAFAVGYSSHSAFAAAFREVTGASPRAYRAGQRGGRPGTDENTDAIPT
ncbi:MAG: helix-turn-helix domain-containing protein [Pseudooceanicola sp.]